METPDASRGCVREQKQLEITRIQAKQAVLIALITAASSIAVTLLAERSLGKVSDPAPDVAEMPSDSGSVPLIFVASVDPGEARQSVEECKRKAGEEMRERRGKIIATGASWIAMELREFGIMVMCHEETHSAAVIVAGKDSKTNGDLAISLRESVLER